MSSSMALRLHVVIYAVFAAYALAAPIAHDGTTIELTAAAKLDRVTSLPGASPKDMKFGLFSG